MNKQPNTPPVMPKNPGGGMPPLHPMGGGPGGGRGPMNARLHKEKPKNLAKTLGRLLKYIGKSKMLLIFLVVIMVVVTVTDLAGPALQGAAIDTVKITSDGLRVDLVAMRGYLIAMGIMFAISATMALFQGRIAAKLSQNTVYNLRNDLFQKISRLPIRYTDTHKHGDIMTSKTSRMPCRNRSRRSFRAC